MNIVPTISPALARLDSFCDNPRQTEQGDLLYTQPINAWASSNGPGSDHDARLHLTKFRGDELTATVGRLFDAASQSIEPEVDGGRSYLWQKTDTDGTFRETRLFLAPLAAELSRLPHFRARISQRTNQVRYEMLTAGDAIYLGGLSFIAKPEDLCHFYKNPYGQGTSFMPVLKSLTTLAAETCDVNESDVRVERFDKELTLLTTPDGRFVIARKAETSEGDVYQIDVGTLETFQPKQALSLRGLTREFADYLRLRRVA